MAASDAADAPPAPSRSPSPPIAPPIASAPGPRATALQKLYTDATAHILRTCNYANFSACFPTMAREASDSLKLLHQDFTERLGEHWRTNFESILDNRNVVGSLNELDSLIEDARRRKKGSPGDAPVPPHTLSAQQLYLSHLAPSLAVYSQEIKERQDAVQEDNIEMLGRVMQQRKEIEALMKGLEGVAADIDASVAALDSEDADIESSRDAVRDVDTDMRLTA